MLMHRWRESINILEVSGGYLTFAQHQNISSKAGGQSNKLQQNNFCQKYVKNQHQAII